MEYRVFVRVIVCVYFLVELCGTHRYDTVICQHISIPQKKAYHMGTRGAWAHDFLIALGNSNPSEDTEKLVAAWTFVENTRAMYNPLATTQPYDGATKFNTANVKNYPSREAGIAATIETVNQDHAGYSELREGLKHNDPTRSIASFGFDTWGSHTNKVAGAYAIDHRNEPLKSEESGSVSGGSFGGNEAQEPQPDRSRPTAEQQPQQTTGTVSEQDIRNIAKGFLGILFIGIGGLLFIIAIMKTDTARTITETAVKAAL